MTSFVQLSARLEAATAEWRNGLADEGDIDDDLLEACADVIDTIAAALASLSGLLETELSETDDDVLGRLPADGQAFVARFHAGTPDADFATSLQATLEGFEEVRVLMQEREAWDIEEDRSLDRARRAAEFLAREEWDEDGVQEWLDGDEPT